MTLHEAGAVDLDRIAELLGRSRDEALAELGKPVFLNPATDPQGFEVWETADAYLSGPVRTKLAAAVAAASAGRALRAQCRRARRPSPRTSSRPTSPPGSAHPGCPPKWWRPFSPRMLGVETPVRHTVEIAAWSIDIHAFAARRPPRPNGAPPAAMPANLLNDALNA